jgi:hypothetical protein
MFGRSSWSVVQTVESFVGSQWGGPAVKLEDMCGQSP